MKLNNKVAIVTGGARDIGKAVSIKLASQGVKVVINYLNDDEQAHATMQLIQNAGGTCIVVKADATKNEDVLHIVEETKKHFGNQIHFLVNVTGGLVARKLLEDMDANFWDDVMALNTRSTFLLTKQVVPFMPAGSAIVNFSSQAARDGGGFGASAYASAKAAVATFTKAMAKELGPKGIRVNAVDPGMIATSFHDTFTKPEVRTAVANSTPLRRQGDATDVANLVVYLLSNESSFITGANIDINGGCYFS